MIEDFEIVKEIFEQLPHGSTHFSLNLEGKSYSGLYSNGEVNWFHPQPDPEEHTVDISDVEAEIHKKITELIQ